MEWMICFCIAVGIFALTAVGLLCARLKHKRKVGVLNYLIGATFVATMVLFIPIFRTVFSQSLLGWIKTMFLSLYNAICLFVVNGEYDLVLETVRESSAVAAPIYTVVFSALFVVCPIFTFGFILTFFRNATSYFRLMTKCLRKIYVFSELNEKSITLAQDLKAKNRKRTVVFCDVFEDDGEAQFELIGEAKKLGAICFKKDVLTLNLKMHPSKKPLYFFVIGSDPTENTNQALSLIARYRETENTHLYLFSDNTESELLLSGIDTGAVKVRRIDEVLSLVNREMYYNGYQIFESARPIPDRKEKQITAAVIGMGKHGTEMLKTLVWYCQMDGYFVDIHGFDMNEDCEDLFTATCPEIMSEKYNGVYVDGEAQYKVVIHPGMKVGSQSFAQALKAMSDLTYVFISLGTDSMNVEAAVHIRMLAEQMGIKPIIKAVVHNSKLAESLVGIKNYRGQAYNIDLVGDFNSAYTEQAILGSKMEEDALQRHLKWGREEEFWQYEYNYRSSMASAIHMKAREYCGIPGAGKKEEDLTDAEIAVIEPLEHRRWNAYMRSQGYVFSGSTDKASRNDLGKMHHDLVNFDSLDESEKHKDRTVGSK